MRIIKISAMISKSVSKGGSKCGIALGATAFLDETEDPGTAYEILKHDLTERVSNGLSGAKSEPLILIAR